MRRSADLSEKKPQELVSQPALGPGSRAWSRIRYQSNFSNDYWRVSAVRIASDRLKWSSQSSPADDGTRLAPVVVNESSATARHLKIEFDGGPPWQTSMFRESRTQ